MLDRRFQKFYPNQEVVGQMTIKKYSRNQHIYDEVDERPGKKKTKDRTEKHFKNALRARDVDALQRYSEYGSSEDMYGDEDDWYRK